VNIFSSVLLIAIDQASCIPTAATARLGSATMTPSLPILTGNDESLTSSFTGPFQKVSVTLNYTSGISAHSFPESLAPAFTVSASRLIPASIFSGVSQV